MGKVVLYHPVSLTVLRAAVIYNGYRFGRIHQIYVNTATETARYTCEIAHQPEGMGDYNPLSVKARLQDCFAADVTVLSVYFTPRKEKWMCTLQVSLRQSEKGQAEETDLRWLIDEPMEDPWQSETERLRERAAEYGMELGDPRLPF